MDSACRQPGMEQGANVALKVSGGLARAETGAGSWPAEQVNASRQPELSPEELARLSAQGSVDRPDLMWIAQVAIAR